MSQQYPDRLPALLRIALGAVVITAWTAAIRSAAAAEDPHGLVVDLARTLGPRPTGSDAERRAIEVVAARLESAGCVVRRIPVEVVPERDGERAVFSTNVVGELGGAIGDTVILAAHHDSRNSAVPGANDDASGVAVLVETARRIAQRPRRLTYRFISFCAEEDGLLGSRAYAAATDLTSVRAVIALEMLGRGEILVGPVPGAPPAWAQRRLLAAARGAGVADVVARPLWTLAPRFFDLPFGADHEPFLERGIPAFLVLGTFPGWAYHTAADDAPVVGTAALDRAVRVVTRLLEDMETRPVTAAEAAGEDPHALPVMLFGRGVIVPSLGSSGAAIAALVIAALLALRHIRALAQPAAWLLTLRVLLVTGSLTALALTGPFLSAKALAAAHGAVHPWTAHHNLHVAQAAVWGTCAAWIALKAFRRIKPTVEPGPYLAAALLLPAAWVAAATRAGWPEIALWMTAPLVLFPASTLVESTGRKAALGLAAALPLFCVFTLGDYAALLDLGGVTPPPAALGALLFAAVFPFACFTAHVASFRDCRHSPFWWRVSGRRVGIALLAAALLLLLVNTLLPAYDADHRQLVRVRERLDPDARRAAVTVRSNDTLRGLRLTGAPRAGSRDTLATFEVPFPDGVALSAEAAPGEEPGTILVTMRLRAPVTVERLSAVFMSHTGFTVPGRGDERRHRYTFTRVMRGRDPTDTFRIGLPAGADLSVDLRAEFAQDLLDLEAAAEPARVIAWSATLEAARTLSPPGAPPPAPAPPR